ncbi:putative RNA-binding protein with PIN domain [Marmoricola sp. URHA0025 HA25]
MTGAPEALPERVRARVITYAADALGVLPADHVPGPLKRAATFAPARRARIAGQQILDQLASDDTFRERIAVQAQARHADVASQLAEGAGSVDSAALAFLVRPDGWQVLLDAAAQENARGQQPEEESTEIAALRSRLDAALATQGEIRRTAKAELGAAKSEIADLRRKLGEARAQARASRSDAERSTAEATERTTRLEAEVAAAEGEIRRLKSLVTTREGELARAQRTARTTRDEGTLRARLLMDTLLQAAQGLRQELALPVATGSPADHVEAHLAEAGARPSTGTASRPVDDPALVRELLALPRIHLIIDGYNVTRLEWDATSLEAQRTRLLKALGPLSAQSGAEITVVFDGTNAETRPLVQHPRGVRVLFSPRGVLADDVIRDLVAAEPPGRPVGVVTSDQEIVRDVTRQAGVRVVAARSLVRLLG